MIKLVNLVLITFFLSSNAQTYQWARGIGVATNGNQPNIGTCVTTDAAGNVYMTGHFQGNNLNFNPGGSPLLLSSGISTIPDVFLTKYSPAGICTWAKAISGSSGRGEGIAVDGAGNVYITGNFLGSAVDFDPGVGTSTLSSTGLDIFIAKFDAGGNFTWAKGIGGPNPDLSMSIGLDGSGNPVITGRFLSPSIDFDPGPAFAVVNSGGGTDIFIAKYDANGNYLWAKGIGGTGTDVSNAVSLDGIGNVYIIGTFQGSAVDFDPGTNTATLSSAGTDIYFAKFDPNGNYAWARSVYGSSGTGESISADAAGNILVTGRFLGTAADFDPGAATLLLNAGASGSVYFGKYTSSGNYIWVKALAGPVNCKALTQNAGSKVYITGNFVGIQDFDTGAGTATLSGSGNGGIYIAKYDPAGNYISANRIVDTQPLANNAIYAESIALDPNGNIFTCGSFAGANIDFDPAPVAATLTAISGYSDIYLAKYAYCSTSTVKQQSICVGGSYAFNGHIYTLAGTYNDTLYTTFGCDSILTTQLSVTGQPPLVTIAGSGSLCPGSSSTLTANGALSYTWSNGPQNSVNIVIPGTGSIYNVTGTGPGGCTASASVQALFIPSLNVSTGRQVVCKGESIAITASGANSYTWSSGQQTAVVVATMSATTIYTVTGSFTNSPCLSKQTFTVNVNPCLGANEAFAEKIEVSVYPNPASNELFYTVAAGNRHHFLVTNVNGLKYAEGEQTGQTVRLDLSSYPSGFYNLTISVGKVTQTTRFVVKKNE